MSAVSALPPSPPQSTPDRLPAPPEPGELEHQQTDGAADGYTGPQERFHEQVRVQKILISLPGHLAKPIQLGKLFEGDRVRHLEPEHEVVRRLIDHALQIRNPPNVVL